MFLAFLPWSSCVHEASGLRGAGGEASPVTAAGASRPAACRRGTGPWDIWSPLTPFLEAFTLLPTCFEMYLYELTYIIEQTQTMKTSRAMGKGFSSSKEEWALWALRRAGEVRGVALRMYPNVNIPCVCTSLCHHLTEYGERE